MVEYLDHILKRITELLELGLVWEQTERKIKDLLEMKDEEENYVFDLIQQNPEKYPLLVGFCYSLGIGTVKDERKALNEWDKDATSYGHYLTGRSYDYGIG